MAISTTSFSNTPQATDDTYLTTEDNYLTQVWLFDVMSNDLGGNAKSLYSIDNGVEDDGTAGADLLIKDVVGVVESSLRGATIKLTSDGKVSYDPSAFSPALKAQIQALAPGQELIDTFTYAIRLGNGTLSWATVTVKIAGSNDNPTVTASAQSVPLVEAGASGAGTSAASITLTLVDVDSGDAAAYDTTVMTSTGGWTDNGTTFTKVGVYGTATLTKASGVVSYALDNLDADTNMLAGGAAASDNFTVYVKDGSTGTASTAVNFAITGSNDNPTVTAGAQSAQLVEAGVAGAGTSSASITLTLVDVDSGDAASYNAAALTGGGWATSNGGATYTKLGTYGTATLTTATNVVSYLLDNNSATNALMQGAAVSDNFTVFVKDGSTGTASTAVNFAITGSNDNPTVTASAQSVPLVEAGASGAGTSAASITLTLVDVDSGDAAAYDTTVMTSTGGWTDNGTTFTKVGVYGTATLTKASGVVSYALDNLDADTNMLAGGAAASDNFTVYVKDGSTGTASTAVNFAITGSNDNPTVTAGAQSAQLVEAGVAGAGTSSASITLTLVDVDSGDAASYNAAALTGGGWATSNGGATYTKLGTYGTATLTTATNVVSYLLDNNSATNALMQGAAVSDNFTVFVKDGSTGTASTAVNFAITGSNDNPTVTASAQSVPLVEAGASGAGTSAASITLTLVDVDSGDAAAYDTTVMTSTGGWTDNGTTFTKVGVYGTATLTKASGVVSYALDNLDADTNMLAGGAAASDNFTVYVKDGSTGTASTAVNFAITGSNDNPTVTAGAQSAQLVEAGVAGAGTSSASITLTLVDVDSGDAASYNAAALTGGGWATSNGGATYTKLGTYGTATLTTATNVVSYLLDNNSATNALMQGAAVSDNFTVFVKDGSTGTASTAVNFAITGSNDNPTVTASAQSVPLVEAGASGAGTSAASITLTLVDVDSGDAAAYDTTVMTSTGGWTDNGTTFTKVGVYGTATLTKASGVVSYALDNLDADTNMLAGGAAASDNFTVYVKDGSTGTASTAVNFAITGSNDNPTVTAGAQSAQLVEAGVAGAGTSSASITLTLVDVDSGDAASYNAAALTGGGWATSNGGATYTKLGTYGTATLTTATNVVSYLLDNNSATNALMQGAAVSDNFTVFVKDGSTGTASTAVNFAITGSNDNPTVTASAQSVPLVEAGASGAGTSAASITLTLVDVDSGDAAAYDTTVMTSTGGWTDNGTTFTKVGVYGTATLTKASGVVSYALDNLDADTNMLAGGAAASDNFTVYVKDGSTGTASTAVNFAITGSNDNPTVTAGAQSAQLVEAGVAGAGTSSASITLTLVDVDSGDAASYNAAALTGGGWATSNGGATYTKLGTYGTATLTTATNVVSYLLDNNSATNALMQGAAVSDNFTVFVKDGSTGTASTAVNFAITGSNDNPTVTASAQSVPLVEAGASGAGTSAASITLTLVDVDSGDAAAYDTTVMTSTGGWTDNGTTFTKVGVYGTATLTKASGVVSYALDNLDADTNMLAGGAAASDNFTVYVKDGSTGTASTAVNFAITGSNDTPLIAGTSTGAVTEDTNVAPGNLLTTSGALTINDADQGQSSFLAQAATAGSSNLGTFTLATNGNWTYTANNSLAAIQALNNGQSLTDSFTAVSFDGTGTRVVTVTIHGVDDVNALTGGTGANNYSFSTTVSADSTISDAGGSDTISFTGANAISKLNFERIGSDLVVDVNNQHVVVLNQYGADGANTIEDVQFAAGQTFHGYSLAGTYTLVTTQTPANGNTNWVMAGSSGVDTLTGGNNNNQKDLIFGNASGDTLTGRAGQDLLVGGAGFDIMSGGDGNDTLVGGDGNDILTGGAGIDTFVFHTALNASSNVDKITDFQANATDLIWLSKTIFSGISTGASNSGSVLQASEFASVASGGATASVDNDVRVIFDTSTGNLYYDANGGSQGMRTLFATLETAGLTGTVDATDFRVGA